MRGEREVGRESERGEVIPESGTGETGTTTWGGGVGGPEGGAEKEGGVDLHPLKETDPPTTILRSELRHHQCTSKPVSTIISLMKCGYNVDVFVAEYYGGHCSLTKETPVLVALGILCTPIAVQWLKCVVSEVVSLYRRVGGRSPDVEPPSEERDKRTVMCMQLSSHVGPSELEEFFQKVGQVKEVKMIADKNSRRSKGIAYVEFHDEKSIPGVSVLVSATLA